MKYNAAVGMVVFHWLSGLQIIHADFVYATFNDTTALIFNGAAGTTRCNDDPLFRYGDVQGNADTFSVDVVKEIQETTALLFELSTQTNVDADNKLITQSEAGFLHRSDTINAPTSCSIRSRLTPSTPSAVGSMWYRDDVPVLHGFDTYFTFQITDHSKECNQVKDQYLSQRSYTTCNVHGADGFAFVIQYAPNTTATLGNLGGQMGFGGIENSLAIAFDTWQNPGEDSLGVDHVSVQSLGKGANDGLEAGLIGLPRYTPLANGAVHKARIVYFDYLEVGYFDKLVASDSLLPYLKDNGEGKRVGTLAVFIDQGIEDDVPLLAMPINLSLLLKLPVDSAFVGFTSSTGRFYEKHDILSWVWCNKQPCEPPILSDFDYHGFSKFSNSKRQYYTPGPGYGGSGDPKATFPIKNTNPDTTPWQEPVQHFASTRNTGLSPIPQVPPDTLY